MQYEQLPGPGAQRLMGDDPANVRPMWFDLWTHPDQIKCPSCAATWYSPQIDGATVAFDPRTTPELRETELASKGRAFCPACGERYPENAVLAAANRISPPTAEKKTFIGTVSGIREFLQSVRGNDTRPWEYSPHDSIFVLAIESRRRRSRSFVVCLETSCIILPKCDWRSRLSFNFVGDDQEERWALIDEVAECRIECRALGIYPHVTFC